MLGHDTLCLGRQDALNGWGNFDYSPPARHRDAAIGFATVFPCCLKVYLHDPTTLPAVRERLEAYLTKAGHGVDVLYLQGDVCRSDLMVEVEGIYA